MSYAILRQGLEDICRSHTELRHNGADRCTFLRLNNEEAEFEAVMQNQGIFPCVVLLGVNAGSVPQGIGRRLKTYSVTFLVLDRASALGNMATNQSNAYESAERIADDIMSWYMEQADGRCGHPRLQLGEDVMEDYGKPEYKAYGWSVTLHFHGRPAPAFNTSRWLTTP